MMTMMVEVMIECTVSLKVRRQMICFPRLVHHCFLNAFSIHTWKQTQYCHCTPLWHCLNKNTNDSVIKEPDFCVCVYVHRLTLLHHCQLQNSFFQDLLMVSSLLFFCEVFSSSHYWLTLLDPTFVGLNTSFFLFLFFCCFFNSNTTAPIFSAWLFESLSIITGAVLHVILPGFHTTAAGSAPPRINVGFIFLLN